MQILCVKVQALKKYEYRTCFAEYKYITINNKHNY